MASRKEFNKKLFMFICGQIIASNNQGNVSNIVKACEEHGVDGAYAHQFIRIMNSKGYIITGSRNYIKFVALTKEGCDLIREMNSEQQTINEAEQLGIMQHEE